MVPTGSATGARRTRPAAGQRGLRRIAGTAITAILASTLVPGLPAYAATPPTAPDNITVFPDRDFVSADYPNQEGKTATVTVTRAGVVTGSAEGTVSGGLLEVHHPGGVCWGTNPAIAAAATPDIRPGDDVSVSFAGGPSDSVMTQSPMVTSSSRPTPNTVVVLGTLGALDGPAANTANLEQRIVVGPALAASDVGKKDVRAVAGPMTPAATGGYSSSLEFSGDTFTATYNFASASSAALAADGQMRALTWMTTNGAGDRQGITIAEAGEVGGPGMGGCPANNPGAVPPSTPGIGTATAGNASALVRWNRPVQGSSVITGYSVQVLDSNGGQDGLLRAAPETATASNARSLNVTGLTAGRAYHFQVRATNAAGNSAFSAPSNTVSPLTVAGAPGILRANPGAIGGTVTARANWTAPASNGGTAITGYVVTAMRINARGSVVIRTNSVTQHFSVRSLAMTLPAGNYRFAVRARNAMGMSAYSASSQVVTAR